VREETVLKILVDEKAPPGQAARAAAPRAAKEAGPAAGAAPAAPAEPDVRTTPKPPRGPASPPAAAPAEGEKRPSFLARARDAAPGVARSLARNAGDITSAAMGEAGPGLALAGAAEAALKDNLHLLGKAAPPVAAAFKVAETAATVLAAAQTAAARNTQHFAGVMADLIQNDVLGAQLRQLKKQQSEADSAQSFSLILGPIVKFFSGTEKKIARIEGFLGVRQAAASEAQRLGGLSAPLAAANAEAQLIRLRADIRNAQRLGPSLGRAQVASAQFDVAMQNALAPIKEAMFKQLTASLESGKFNEKSLEKLEALKDDTKLLELIKGNTKESKELQKRLVEELKKAREQREDLTGKKILESLFEGVKLIEEDRRPDPIAWAKDAAMRPLG
jgi:hypothetical protein